MFTTPPLNPENKKPVVFGLPKMREKVIDMLGNAYSSNDLDIEEYEKRLAIAHNSQSVDELKNVIYDFPEVGTLFPAVAKTSLFSSRSHTGLTTSKADSSFLNIVGNKEISAYDISSPTIEVISLIGDTVLDLRDIGSKFTHLKIETYGAIGNLKIRVPANAQVKKNIFVFIGNLTQKVRGGGFWNKLMSKITKEVPVLSNPNPNPPIFIELSGLRLIGEVTIEYEKE